MSKVNIGIIGKGFVGSAVANGFSANTGFSSKIRIYDVDPSKSTHSLEDVVNLSDFVFISVPSPTDFKNNTINLSIIERCFSDISDRATNKNTIFLLRSTIVPGTTRKIADNFPNLRIVFNPEFLTQRSAFLDFINQARFIFGGCSEDTNKVSELMKKRFGNAITIIETNYEEAELIKYMCNTFFATKISFLNDIYKLSNKLNLDWNTILEGFVSDGRIGHSHLNIPGPDGKLGFGGACFPKDITAFIDYANSKNVKMHTLEGAWNTNLEVRPERDWEK